MKWIFHLYLAAVCFASGLAGAIGAVTVTYSALYYTFPVLKEEPYRIEGLMYPHCAKDMDSRYPCKEPLSEESARAKVHEETQIRALRDGVRNAVWFVVALLIFATHWRLFKRTYLNVNEEVKG